jgi:hypothetical protein
MIKKLIAMALIYSFLGLSILSFGGVAQAQTPNGIRLTAIQGFTFPLSSTQGNQSFVGNLIIRGFSTRVVNGTTQLVANVLVAGTLTNTTTGAVSLVTRSISQVVSLLPASTATCEILNLVLGPLDLDLLGLVVHLDRIVLDIDAQSGPGNLLGNLLCGITNLLNPGNLRGLGNTLNRIIGLLG